MDRKKWIAVLLTFALLLSLAACGGQNSGSGAGTDAPSSGTGSAQPQPSSQGGDAQSGTASEGGSSAQPQKETIEDRLKLFAEFLPGAAKTMAEEYEDCDPHYELIYLDDDDLPELVIAPDWYHAAAVYVYMAVGGEVKEVGAYGEYGTFYYQEHGSIVEDGHYGMGVSSSSLYSVGEDAATELLKSWYQGEISDYENDTYEMVYAVDGENCDAETYETTSSEWAEVALHYFTYENGESYGETKDSLYDALQYLYENHTDYILDLSGSDPALSIEDVEGEWILYSYENEGSSGLAAVDEMNDHLIFYADGSVDLYEQIRDEDPLDIDGLQVETDDDGYLCFRFNDYRLGINNEITYTVLEITDDGMLHVSSMLEFEDGTYGGSDLFYEKESGE